MNADKRGSENWVVRFRVISWTGLTDYRGFILVAFVDYNKRVAGWCFLPV
jgi:hypothetical protein